MTDRFVAVNRPRVSLNTAAVLDTETNLWTAFIDDTGAVKAAEYLNAGDMSSEDYVGWRPDVTAWSSSDPGGTDE